MTASQKPGILVVDDDSGHRITLKTVLKSWNYTISEAEDGKSAVRQVQNAAFDLILMDVRMAVMSGIEALQEIKAYNPSIPVIIMTAYSSVESAVEAMKSGAYDYLTKPLDFDELKLTIDRAMEHTQLRQENRELKSKLKAGVESDRIIGTSPVMHRLMDMVATVAPSEATVLITGESGTGKELVARAIHDKSPRKDRPFVVIDCSAFPSTLIESELFGHTKGAFTGATNAKAGRFEQADGGTVFLDEIGEIPFELQVKLLRVLQTQRFERLGGRQTIEVDMRIIAATNKDLLEEVRAGRFREDLYYRLEVIPIHLPPLRSRGNDVALLARHFLTLFSVRLGKQMHDISPQAIRLILRYPWPGNVRELENVMEQAVIMARGDRILPGDLPDKLLEPSPQTTPEKDMWSHERDLLVQTLDECGWNKKLAAEKLGIGRSTLYSKLRRYNLQQQKE